MDPRDIVAQFLYEKLGAAHGDNRAFVPYTEAEFSQVGLVQDAFFRANRLSSELFDLFTENGLVVRAKVLEPVE